MFINNCLKKSVDFRFRFQPKTGILLKFSFGFGFVLKRCFAHSYKCCFYISFKFDSCRASCLRNCTEIYFLEQSFYFFLESMQVKQSTDFLKLFMSSNKVCFRCDKKYRIFSLYAHKNILNHNIRKICIHISLELRSLFLEVHKLKW